MAGGAERTVTVAVGGLAADAATVDALARLALAARRAGCELRLRRASPELLGLVELVGLGELLRAEEDHAPPRSDALAICGSSVRALPRPGTRPSA